ncbi:hypothetical protein MNBD_GAMMA14-2378 [hydrothermal vent metagenome]|uniref:Phage abortive infection protein n=1 Tax=hydrothermal vent metagenome TaxID=652676 RepID=A0A3B0YDQ5_9ZZZZ
MSTSANSTSEMKNSTWHLWVITVIAVLSISLVLLLYSQYFDGDITSDNEKWGTFGDFIGGTLNPILSFLALIALLYTIHIQSKELKLSRRELKLSRDELQLTRTEMERTADATQQQAKHFEREERRTDTYRLIEKLAGRINNNINRDGLPYGFSLHSILYQTNNITRNGVTIENGINELCKWRDNKDELTLSLIDWLSNDLKYLMHYLQLYKLINQRGAETARDSVGIIGKVIGKAAAKIHVGLVPDFYIQEFGHVTHVLYENDMLPKELHDYYCKKCKISGNKQDEH